MKLNLVMDDIATALETVSGLRVFGYPPPTVSAPAGYVSYPERVAYHGTYGPTGMMKIEGLPVVLVVGKATDRSARESVAAYTAPDGTSSVKLALESIQSANFSVLIVSEAAFDIITIGTNDYVAAIFTCDIVGSGT